MRGLEPQRQIDEDRVVLALDSTRDNAGNRRGHVHFRTLEVAIADAELHVRRDVEVDTGTELPGEAVVVEAERKNCLPR